jgi:hypothetical protein
MERTNPLDGCLHVYLDVGSNRGIQVQMKQVVEDRLCIYTYIYRNVCFTFMAPVRQLICQCRWRKSTNPFESKIRQLF